MNLRVTNNCCPDCQGEAQRATCYFELIIHHHMLINCDGCKVSTMGAAYLAPTRKIGVYMESVEVRDNLLSISGNLLLVGGGESNTYLPSSSCDECERFKNGVADLEEAREEMDPPFAVRLRCDCGGSWSANVVVADTDADTMLIRPASKEAGAETTN